MRSSPFDHRPWRELGRALRDVLDPSDNRTFVARVMEEIRAVDVRRLGNDWWAVLGAWARPGLMAAAALAALAVGLTISADTTAAVEEITAEDALRATAETSVLTLAADPPDVEFILAVRPER